MTHRYRFLAVLGVAVGCLLAPVNAQDKEKVPLSKKSVSTFTSGEAKINVWQWAPVKEGKHPAVVLLHGIDGLKGIEEAVYGTICRRVADRGYVVYFVHYMDRTHDPKQNGMELDLMIRTALVGDGNGEQAAKVRALYKNWMTVVKEAVGHLRKQENVDADKVGLVGFSLGGYLAVSVATLEPDLKLGGVIEMFGGLPRELHDKVKAPLPPLLVMHAKDDDVVPFQECEALKKVLTDRKVAFEEKVFERAGHMFFNKDGQFDFFLAALAETRAMAFLEKHLKGKDN